MISVQCKNFLLTNIQTPPNGRPYRTPDSTLDRIAEVPIHKYWGKFSSSLYRFAGVSQCSCRRNMSGSIDNSRWSLIVTVHVVRHYSRRPVSRLIGVRTAGDTGVAVTSRRRLRHDDTELWSVVSFTLSLSPLSLSQTSISVFLNTSLCCCCWRRGCVDAISRSESTGACLFTCWLSPIRNDDWVWPRSWVQ